MSNGAKALAERLVDAIRAAMVEAKLSAGVSLGVPEVIGPLAAERLLADGAVFLTAEEAERVEQLRTRLGDCDEALTTVEVAYSRRDDEIERLRRIEAAARSMFAVESGVCVECGWVGSHGDNPDRFAKECLTLPLRAALTEPSREAVQ